MEKFKFSGLFLIIFMVFISIILQNLAVHNSNYSSTCSNQTLINCNKTLLNKCTQLDIHETIVMKNYCCNHSQCICNLDKNVFEKLNFFCKTNYSSNTSFLFFIGLSIIIASTNTVFYLRRFILMKLGLTIDEVKHIDIYSRGFRDKYDKDKEFFNRSVEKLLLYNNNSESKNKIIIRSIDFFGRKTLHFISLMLFTYLDAILYGNNLVPSYSTFIAIFFSGFLISLIIYFSINLPNKIKNCFLPSLYGGCNRIQDGNACFLNIITALCVGSIQTITIGTIMIFYMKEIIYLFAIRHKFNIHEIRKLYLLSWILTNNGVIFGDTSGEGVGAFLGSHRFKVKGFIGQENQRSYEGCLGVFIFTLIPDLIAIFFFSSLFNLYLGKTILLLLILSFGTMIIEMISFKGTDNLLITLFSMFINIVWFKWVF